MDRPVWLLDVDGVINVARPGWGAAPRSGNAYSAGQAYRMRWAPALVERIRALHRAGSVALVQHLVLRRRPGGAAVRPASSGPRVAGRAHR